MCSEQDPGSFYVTIEGCHQYYSVYSALWIHNYDCTLIHWRSLLSVNLKSLLKHFFSVHRKGFRLTTRHFLLPAYLCRFHLFNRCGEFRNITGGQFAIRQIATQDRLLPLCPLLWIAYQAKPLNLLFNAGQRFSQGCCKDRVRSGLRTCGDTTDIKLRLCLFC